LTNVKCHLKGIIEEMLTCFYFWKTRTRIKLKICFLLELDPRTSFFLKLEPTCKPFFQIEASVLYTHKYILFCFEGMRIVLFSKKSLVSSLLIVKSSILGYVHIENENWFGSKPTSVFSLNHYKPEVLRTWIMMSEIES
jgi:hypothetical protein